MKFTYCPDCGTRLTPREIGDEGLVPYCNCCKKPLFDMFSTCIIVLVVNEYGEAALLRQGYISDTFYNLVSGYMKPGENAETTAIREVEEEIGITVERLRMTGTYWFGKKDMLMIGFIGEAKKRELVLSGEVDEAVWVPASRALQLVHPAGSISHTLVEYYLNVQENRED